MKFKVGDKVRFIDEKDHKDYGVLRVDEYKGILKVVHGFFSWQVNSMFQLVEEKSTMAERKFKAGDDVYSKNDNTKVFKVIGYHDNLYKSDLNDVVIAESNGFTFSFDEKNLEFVDKTIKTDNGECKMPTKEEFKIDKIGHYYRTRECHPVKILYKIKNGPHPILGVIMDGEKETDCTWSETGKFLASFINDDIKDIIEYIGPELPQEPREFKFNAYIGENERIKSNSSYSIQNALTNECTIPYTKKDHIDMADFEKVSKWEFTMKELPE